MHAITEILQVEPYKLTVRFKTEEVRQIDLSSKLSEWSNNPNSKFADLKDPNIFKKVKLDQEFETLVWENGIDLCPDVLYSLSQEVRQVV
jgi:hypothetical protein